MHSSLDWIEWLDRLERVLQSARSDLTAYSRAHSPSRLAMLKVAHRQLEVLLGQLQWMDPRVLVGDAPPAADDIVDRLRVVLGTAVLRLSRLSGGNRASSSGRSILRYGTDTMRHRTCSSRVGSAPKGAARDRRGR